MSLDAPTLSIPSPAYHRVSGPHDFIGLSIHQQNVTASTAVEQREVEGIGKRHASTRWLYGRWSMTWLTHNGEDDPDNLHRRNCTTEFPGSKPLAHRLAPPSLQSPPMTQSRTPYSHINSIQPTYHPAMIVASVEREPDVERIRGGGLTCCGFTLSGPQGTKQGIELKSNGRAQSGPPAPDVDQTEPAGTPMRETISRPMTPSRGPARSRTPSHSSPKPGQGAPSGSRPRRPSQAQVADNAKRSSERAPRSRTPSQAADTRPRAQSDAKEPRSRTGSMAQSRSRANSRAGQPDSARPRLDPHHFSSAAPTLPPVPVTPINFGYP